MARTVPASLRPALELYAARLRARFGVRVRSVVLFGSFARGEANEDSDVDVLAVIDGLSADEVGMAAGEVAPVILGTGLPLAPLVVSSERWESLRLAGRALAREIDAEGITL